MILLLGCLISNKYPYTGTELFDSFVQEAIEIDDCFKEKIDILNQHCKSSGSKMVALRYFYTCGGEVDAGSLTLDNRLIGLQDPSGYAKLLCKSGDRTLWYLLASYQDTGLGIYPGQDAVDVF
jgi:hypothetical protein